jgi:hypothetical protein
LPLALLFPWRRPHSRLLGLPPCPTTGWLRPPKFRAFD